MMEFPSPVHLASGTPTGTPTGTPNMEARSLPLVGSPQFPSRSLSCENLSDLMSHRLGGTPVLGSRGLSSGLAGSGLCGALPSFDQTFSAAFISNHTPKFGNRHITGSSSSGTGSGSGSGSSISRFSSMSSSMSSGSSGMSSGSSMGQICDDFMTDFNKPMYRGSAVLPLPSSPKLPQSSALMTPHDDLFFCQSPVLSSHRLSSSAPNNPIQSQHATHTGLTGLTTHRNHHHSSQDALHTVHSDKNALPTDHSILTQSPSFTSGSSTDPLKDIELQLASEERSLFLRLQQIRQLQSEHQFPHTCTPSEIKEDYSEASKIYKDLGELPPLRVISQQQIDPIGYRATTEAAAAAAAEAKAKAPNSRNAACAACYRSKVACDKGRPCSRCVRSGKECVTRPPVKLGRPRRKRPESEEESTSSGSGSTSEEPDHVPKKRRATGTRSRPQKRKRKAR